MNTRIKAYSDRLMSRCNELCCAWEISLELENETELDTYIDGLLSHKDDCICLSIVARELEDILYQNRLDKYC